MMHNLLPCKVIHSKKYQHGTLFALTLSKQVAIRTIDNQISYIDQSLQLKNGTSSTNFTSISDILSGKTKTFGIGEHKFDEHYRVIFSIDGHSGRQDTTIHEGVDTWYPPKTADSEDGDIEAENVTGDENDEAPAPSIGKKLATTPKKRKLKNGDPASIADFELVNQEEEANSLKLELDECKEEIEVLKAELEKYSTLSTELADSRGEVRAIKEKLEKRKTDMRKYRSENENLKEALTQSELQVLNHKEALTHAEEEIKTLKEAEELQRLNISTDDALMGGMAEKPKPVDPAAEEGEEECIELVMSMGYEPAPSIEDIRSRYRNHMRCSKTKRPSVSSSLVCNAMRLTYQSGSGLAPLPKATQSSIELEQLKIRLAKAEEINAELQQKVDEHNPALETSDDPFILRIWSIGNDPVPTIAELYGCVARAIQADLDNFPQQERITLAVVQHRLYGYYRMLFEDKKNDPKVPAKPSLQMQLKAAESRMNEMHKLLYMEDGGTWIDFYKNKYNDQLISDYATGEPYVNPLTGEVTPKSKKYEEELNKALAKIEEFQMMMPSAQTNILLERAQKKARQFKRKYRYVKTYLDENQYISDVEDEFCDSDKVIHYTFILSSNT